MPPRRMMLWSATALYTLFIAALTCGPQPVDDTRGSMLRTVLDWLAGSPITSWLTYSLIEFVANIAMFVPFGVLAAALAGQRRWWVAFAAGCACTLIIETVQLALPDRVSDPRDLVANSLGTLVGVALQLASMRARDGRANRAP
ncbi:hypothetical protein GCM10027416_24720 [Okibacterium endophyticum]